MDFAALIIAQAAPETFRAAGLRVSFSSNHAKAFAGFDQRTSSICWASVSV